MLDESLQKSSVMELDLDSFLQSIEIKEDDRSDISPYRTVDDILNDSDTSSSSTPVTPNSSYMQQVCNYANSASHEDEDDVIYGDKVSLRVSHACESSHVGGRMHEKETISDSISTLSSRNDAFGRLIKGFVSDQRSTTRASTPLTRGFSSNPGRPGVALAAATAASSVAVTRSRKARTNVPDPVLHSKNSGSVGVDTQAFAYDHDSHHDTISDDHPVDKVKYPDKLELIDLHKIEQSVESCTASESAGMVVMPHELNPTTPASTYEMAGNAMADNSVEVQPSSSAIPKVDASINLKESLNLNDDSALSGYNDQSYISSSESDGFMESGESCSTKCGNFTGNMFNSNTEEENLTEAENYIHNDKEVVAISGHRSNSYSATSYRADDLLTIWDDKKRGKRVKKKAHQMKLLELAEEIEKQMASTGLHWEEGAAAQPMRLEGVQRGSPVLGYFNIDSNNDMSRMLSSHSFMNDYGSPQSLAAHPNFIGVGTSKGMIIVVPSRYDPCRADIMDTKVVMLGSQGVLSRTAVTSMCFNQQGDLLLAGYADGHVTVWDVPRTTPVKVISGEHSAPIVHTMFLGQGVQVTRQFKAVTGDSKGLVLLHSFSAGLLLNRFSIETQCLFDGKKTGVVVCAVLLHSDEIGDDNLVASSANNMSSSSLGTMMGGIVGSGDSGWNLFSEGFSVPDEGVVIFVTYQIALVARLTPTLKVYAKISRPDGVREGSIPYASWKSIKHACDASNAVEKTALLALGWDRKVLVASLVGSKLNLLPEWILDASIIGLMWLDDQVLVVLTSSGKLCLFEKDGTLIYQTSYVVNGHEPDDVILYHTFFTNIYGNPEKAYNNFLAVRGFSVYILGPTHLIVSRLLPWKERILVLRNAGDWMEALSMAMIIFDGRAHGVFDVPRTLEAIHEAVAPFHMDLLLSYVDEVFSYISVACRNQIERTEHVEVLNHDFVGSEIKEQYARVGGVAVEFCVHIKRTDFLFNEVFGRFVSVQQRDAFLELLEPYILKDLLGSLPPEIMQALVEHYSTKGWLDRVEQCVLHMDISSLDFNQVAKLCREHGLYGALIYLFNRGLDDFIAPLEELLGICFKHVGGESAVVLGYKLLVYLKYCFCGLAFPPGSGALSVARLPSLRAELVQFLLDSPGIQSSDAISSMITMGTRRNVHYFLELDTEATLDVLKCAFVEHEALKFGSSLGDPIDASVNSEADNFSFLIQNAIDALIATLDKTSIWKENHSGSENISLDTWPIELDRGHMFDFITHYVSCGKAIVSKGVLNQIFEYLTSPDASTEISGKRVDQVLSLLEVVPATDWYESSLLHLCEKAGFWKVCGLIHTLRQEYSDALSSYILDESEPVHAFSFISNMLLQINGAESDSFRSLVISRVADLLNLSREGTFFMVMAHFSEDVSRIIEALHTHPRSLFLYLKTVIDVHLYGTLDFGSLRRGGSLKIPRGRKIAGQLNDTLSYLGSLTDFPKILSKNPIYATTEMIELYLELLCQYERGSVLKFLQTFDSYKTEYCLRLCLDHGIIDAAAFLLERVGDVGGALQLMLSSLNDKFIKLDSSISNAASSGFPAILASPSKIQEVGDVLTLLHECIGLCQRNTHGLDSRESDILWFQLLDSFCEPLVDKYNSSIISGEDNRGMLATHGKAVEMISSIKWKFLKTNPGAQVLKKLFSQFIRKIVEEMIGHVHLPEIMSKLLSDNCGQEFGDFKLTIMDILGTYGFERKILETAKFLIEDDMWYTMSLLRKWTCRGFSPRDLLCCICHCSLNKQSSTPNVRIFSCGHAFHLQCDPEYGPSNHASSSGCPLCTPKKKAQKPRNKFISTEGGLVSGTQTRKALSGLHLHEFELQENSQSHQISRFEILTKLEREGKMEIRSGPQLKLAPPALYHEKVKKGFVVGRGDRTSELPQPIDVKAKSSKIHFAPKSSIFRRHREPHELRTTPMGV